MFGRRRRKVDEAPEPEAHGSPAGVPRWPLEILHDEATRPDDGAYTTLCLTPAFPEEPETRTIVDGYALDRIIEVAQTDGPESSAMARLVEELLADPRYQHLDTLYSWLAPVYRGTDRQLEVIEGGLRTCPRKHDLLQLAGAAMLERRRRADALYYWAHSVTNAESIGDGQDSSAYDYLIVVARVIGERSAAKAFRARADLADHPPTSLDEDTTRLVENAFRKPTRPMKDVITTLAHRIPT